MQLEIEKRLPRKLFGKTYQLDELFVKILPLTSDVVITRNESNSLIYDVKVIVGS